MTERVAYHFFKEIVPVADAIIDIHSVPEPDEVMPHVRQRINKPTKEHLELARATGLRVLWRGQEIPGMLQVESAKIGIPCATVEIGTTRRVRKKDVEKCLLAIRNVMRFYDMFPGRARIQKDRIQANSDDPWITSPAAGRFKWNVQPGDVVSKGSCVGVIENTSSNRDIRSSENGVVFAVRKQRTVEKDTPLFCIVFEAT